MMVVTPYPIARLLNADRHCARSVANVAWIVDASIGKHAGPHSRSMALENIAHDAASAA